MREEDRDRHAYAGHGAASTGASHPRIAYPAVQRRPPLDLSGMDAERILIGAECVGDAKWFIAKASNYTQRSAVFGRRIGQNQGIQFPIAKAYASMRAAEGGDTQIRRRARLRPGGQHGKDA